MAKTSQWVDHLDVLLARKKQVAIATLLCGLAAVAGYFALPKTYESGVVLEVGIVSSIFSFSYDSSNPSTRDFRTEPIEPVEVVRDAIVSVPFAAKIIENLGLESTTPTKLAKNIKARINEDMRGQELNRQIIVTTKAKGAQQSRNLADAIAELVITRHRGLYDQAMETRISYERTLQEQIDRTEEEIEGMRSILRQVLKKGDQTTASLVMLQANIQEREFNLTNLKRELTQLSVINRTNLKSENTKVVIPSYIPYGPKLSWVIYLVVGIILGFMLSAGYYVAEASVRMRRGS